MRRLLLIPLILMFTTPAQASTLVPLWSNVHRTGTGRPTAAQLKPFFAAAGWAVQEQPGPRWWYYAKGTRSAETNLQESWYLHVNGQRVHDTAHPRLAVMNPESLGWRDHVAPMCALRCFLDGLGTAARLRTTPSIAATWSKERWIKAVSGELRYITLWGGTVLPNSAFEPATAAAFTAAAGRTSSEGFAGLNSLGLILRGRTWVFGKVKAGDSCRRLLAGFLIGRGQGDYFSCFHLDQEPWDVPTELIGTRVGRALGARYKITGGWQRRFLHATVTARYDGTYRIVSR